MPEPDLLRILTEPLRSWLAIALGPPALPPLLWSALADL